MQTTRSSQSVSTSHDYEAVIASYYRCEDSGGLFDTFYDLFFAKSQEIPRKFANTDEVEILSPHDLQQSSRLLVTSDEPDMQEYFEKMLPRLGYEVASVAGNRHANGTHPLTGIGA